MKKKIHIFIAICLFLFLIIPLPSYGSTATSIGDLLKKAEYVSSYYTYGTGLQYSSGLQSMIDSKVGNCSHTAYTMARYAETQGLQSRLVSINSKSGAVHVVSEVNIDGKWIVIDGSNGVIYPHSVYEIANNTSLLADMLGTPTDFSRAYTLPSFWGDLNQINIYKLPDLMVPLSISVKSSSNDFMVPDNSASIVADYTNNNKYAACSSTSSPQSSWIVLDLLATKSVDRISINWYNADNYAKTYTIEGSIDGVNYFSLYSTDNNNINASISEIPLKPSSVRYLRFASSAYAGQQRLLIRNIKVFSDPVNWSNFLKNIN